jgi:diaminohydroxyphosphoribosylaminopyrimidine deaminase/5-amino-6-(5-phosphoribosylamino)uracil reductase
MFTINEEKIMANALILAEKALYKTLPNPAVGAIVVKNGVIVGKGYHRRAGGPHAEVFAIKSAGEKAKGATLFVTLEPCAHWGKTPPCTDLIIKSGIKRVIVSMIDPNPLVAGRGVKILREHGINVDVGLMEEKSRSLNAVYIKNITKKLPYVIFKSAMTLDGRTATMSGDSKWITSSDSRRVVHYIRSDVEGVMVGIGTVLRDNPELTTHGIKNNSPWRIIVDSKLRIPLGAKVVKDKFRGRTIVATTYNAPRQKLRKLMSEDIKIIQVRSKGGRVDLKALLKKLYELNIYRLLVEGGATLGGGLLRENLIDRFVFFIAPKIIGEGKGVFEGFGINRIRYAKALKDVIIRRTGSDLMIEGRL